MGNNSGKGAAVDERLLSPWGLYPDSETWDPKRIRKMILDRKIAPFFPPSEEQRTSEDEECPICMMFYRGGLNTAGCCGQRICTECFLQVAKPTNSRVQCPFCQVVGFSVGYGGMLTQEEWMERQAEEQRVIKLQIAMRQEEIKRDEERAKERERRRMEGLPDLESTHLSASGEIAAGPSPDHGASLAPRPAAAAPTASTREERVGHEMEEDDLRRLLSSNAEEFGVDPAAIEEAIMVHEAIQRSLMSQSSMERQEQGGSATGRPSSASIHGLDGTPSGGNEAQRFDQIRWIDGFEEEDERDDDDSEQEDDGFGRRASPHSTYWLPERVPHTGETESESTDGGREDSAPTIVDRVGSMQQVMFSNRWQIFEEEEFEWSDAQCFLAACTRMWGDFVPMLSAKELLAAVIYSRRLASRRPMTLEENTECLRRCEEYTRQGFRVADVVMFCRNGLHNVLDGLHGSASVSSNAARRDEVGTAGTAALGLELETTLANLDSPASYHTPAPTTVTTTATVDAADGMPAGALSTGGAVNARVNAEMENALDSSNALEKDPTPTAPAQSVRQEEMSLTMLEHERTANPAGSSSGIEVHEIATTLSENSGINQSSNGTSSEEASPSAAGQLSEEEQLAMALQMSLEDQPQWIDDAE